MVRREDRVPAREDHRRRDVGGMHQVDRKTGPAAGDGPT